MTDKKKKPKKGKKEKPDDSLEEYTSKAIRGPERSVRSMLMSEHLILSVTSSPLQAIFHICEAASMLPADEMKKLEIDSEEVETLLTVSALLNEPADFSFDVDKPKLNISITSLLPEWDRYFEPWIKQLAYNAWYEESMKGREHHEELLKDEGRELAIYAFQNLTEPGYKAAVTDFISWGMPKAMRVTEKISVLIDSGTFSDVLKMLQKPVEGTR